MAWVLPGNVSAGPIAQLLREVDDDPTLHLQMLNISAVRIRLRLSAAKGVGNPTPSVSGPV
jgi:hypothetical protein